MVERCRAGSELVFQRLSANPRVTIARPQAALLLAMVAQAGICQISNTDYTAYCTAPRYVLEPYRG